MRTLINTHMAGQKDHATFNLSSQYNRLIKKLEFSYFGIIAMTITIGSCLGGITTMQIFENDAPIWQFAVALSLAMANNVAAIGQAPTKWVVNIFALNILVNGLLLIVNVIS